LKGEFKMAGKLESEVEKILEIGVKFLKEFEGPPSDAFFHTPKGKFCIDQFDFRDKPKAIKLLREIADECEATMVITLAHGLISKYEGTASDPSYFRRDALFAYGETKHSDFGIIQEFERKKNNQIQLGRKTILPKGSVGPMTGFMCKKT
jgi:hypothetical protein